MGMFDKDKEIGLLLTNLFQRGEQFILWSAEVVRDDYPTDLGMATQSRLSVSRIASPGERYDVTTLASAIGAKVREAEADDFPAVVFWTQAPSRYGGEATVLQFVKPWESSGRSGFRLPGADAGSGQASTPPASPESETVQP